MSVTQEIYKEAKTRIPSQKQKILMLLKEAGNDGLTNVQLKDIAIRFSASTNALQLDGYDIELVNEGKGVVRYILHSSEPVREKSVVKSGIELAKLFFQEVEQPSFESFSKFLSEKGLHIKHKPNGIKKGA